MVPNVKSKMNEKLEPETTKLNGLADYQTKSIVSRTVIDKKVGTVTIFAFDEGQGLSEHMAPYDALVYVFDGEAEVVISGKAYNVQEGEMILIPANKPHALNAKSKFKIMLIMIKG